MYVMFTSLTEVLETRFVDVFIFVVLWFILHTIYYQGKSQNALPYDISKTLNFNPNSSKY